MEKLASEGDLRARLRKIEALFAGAGTEGERLAAEAAMERIKARLRDSRAAEADTELKFSIGDPWSRQLFIALCRRYGLRPFRYPRQRRQTIMLRVPESFLNSVLWPEFEQLNDALVTYLSEITERIIREEVHGETGDAEEQAETPRLR